MADTLLGITDQQLIARGKWATLRREVRKQDAIVQKHVVQLHEQGRLILRFIEDAPNLVAAYDAMDERTRNLAENIAALQELHEQLETLRPDCAWETSKEKK